MLQSQSIVQVSILLPVLHFAKTLARWNVASTPPSKQIDYFPTHRLPEDSRKVPVRRPRAAAVRTRPSAVGRFSLYANALSRAAGGAAILFYFCFFLRGVSAAEGAEGGRGSGRLSPAVAPGWQRRRCEAGDGALRLQKVVFVPFA